MTMLDGPKRYVQTVGEMVGNSPHLSFLPTDNISDIIEKMHAEQFGAGIVTDKQGTFLGFVTEREIVRKVFGKISSLYEQLDTLQNLNQGPSLTAWDVMIVAPDTLHPDDCIEDALDVMNYYGYRFMPVLNHKRECFGISDSRELHRQVQIKTKEEMKSKDAILSYLIGPEPYGLGATY